MTPWVTPRPSPPSHISAALPAPAGVTRKARRFFLKPLVRALRDLPELTAFVLSSTPSGSIGMKLPDVLALRRSPATEKIAPKVQVLCLWNRRRYFIFSCCGWLVRRMDGAGVFAAGRSVSFHTLKGSGFLQDVQAPRAEKSTYVACVCGCYVLSQYCTHPPPPINPASGRMGYI